MKPAISLLTDPVPCGRYWLSETAKAVARAVRNTLRPGPRWMRSPYRGHFAVTRSAVEGLRKAGVASNYNPRAPRDLSDVVVVLSGLAALRQALALRRSGEIRRLLAGPNLVDFPSDAKELLCAPEVDLCVTPGPLTCRIYVEDCPELDGRCAAWPAGVDTDYWSPFGAHGRDGKLVVLYDKQTNGLTDPVEPYAAFLQNRGYDVAVVTYGDYAQESYRDVLRRCRLLIGFSAAESQGIAWSEAWSTDVPTLIWHKSRHTFRHPRSQGRTFETSPAPYLSEATGRFFKDREDFARVFADWEAGRLALAPRQWVLENLSDEVCARRLCELAGIRTAA